MFSRFVLAALAGAALAAPAPAPARAPAVQRRQTDTLALETFIGQEFNISLQGAILNIGGVNGNIVPGADPGFVVASPSTVNPNYFYTWTRDSALTQLMLTDELLFGIDVVGNNTIQKIVEQYTVAQAQLQTVTDPSGALWPAGLGLGEPKFYTNGTRFNGAWGRPQNDGPALRATTLLEISEAIFERNPAAFNIVSEIYWPIVHNDLLYVSQYWDDVSYDLWEEVNGHSFFTTAAQHRALVQGSVWADRLNQTCEACLQAPAVLDFLQTSFWNSSGNYILANIDANQVNRSQINADPILAAMHAFDINATCDAPALQPCNSKILATHKVWVDSFRTLYPINQNATAPAAVLTGRYPEDTYYGGNPWYITTLAAAEVLYDAVAQFSMAGQVSVDNISLPFWQDLVPGCEEGTYTDYANVSMLLDAASTYADGFMEVLSMYVPANGTLNEQINKTTGEPISAIALTWSYAAFVTAADRRSGNYPPSWGANTSYGTTSMSGGDPSTYTNSSGLGTAGYNATGQYTPALAAGAQMVTKDCETRVDFECVYQTGQDSNIFLVGNTSLLGNTTSDPAGVIQPMLTGKVEAADPRWYVPAYVPAGETIEYKYVLLNTSTYTFTFENITRYVTAPLCGDNSIETVSVNGSFPDSSS